jgi:hypothetical protein
MSRERASGFAKLYAGIVPREFWVEAPSPIWAISQANGHFLKARTPRQRIKGGVASNSITEFNGTTFCHVPLTNY